MPQTIVDIEKHNYKLQIYSDLYTDIASDKFVFPYTRIQLFLLICQKLI